MAPLVECTLFLVWQNIEIHEIECTYTKSKSVEIEVETISRDSLIVIAIMWVHYSAISCTGCGQENTSRSKSAYCNPRPATMVSERDVHSSFQCFQHFWYPFRSSWWFGRTQNKATTRQPGILCGWSGRLKQSAIGHLFGTYIINFQKHAQDTSFLPFLHYIEIHHINTEIHPKIKVKICCP